MLPRGHYEPLPETNFLGVIIDSKLTFSSHIDFIVSKRKSRLFWMKQLRNMGMNPSLS